MRTAAGKPHPKLQQPGRFAFVIPASAAAPVTGIPREFEGTGTAPSLGGKCHPQYYRIRNSPHCKIQMAECFASGRPHCCNIAWLPAICYGLLPTLPLLKRSVRRWCRRSPKSRRGAAMSRPAGDASVEQRVRSRGPDSPLPTNACCDRWSRC